MENNQQTLPEMENNQHTTNTPGVTQHDSRVESSEIQTLIEELVTSMDEHKEFKGRDDVKEIFNENKLFTKRIKDIKSQITQLMIEGGITSLDIDDFTIEIKSRVNIKHDENTLKEAFGDKYDDYIVENSSEKSNVSLKKRKLEK